MKAKKLFILSTAVLLLAGAFSLSSCKKSTTDGETPVTPVNPDKPDDGSEQTESKIKSLTAKSEVVEMKEDESVSAANLYELKGNKLTAKDKKVTITSEDETVVAVEGTSLTALKVGESKITVVSKVDETKSCSFKVVVTASFFDRKISSVVSSDDDFEHETDEENPYIRTSGSMTMDLYVKSADVAKAYIETKVEWHSTSASEDYPKMGIVFSTESNKVVEDQMTQNKVVYFFNPERAHENGDAATFTRFGVCEIQNGGNWAWNAGVTNEQARHCDGAYSLAEGVGQNNGSFTMGMIRDGLEFHCFVNGNYVFSFEALHDLFSTSVETSGDALSRFGFFEFNSDVTFSNYSFTVDPTEVDQKIATITTKNSIGDPSSSAAIKWAQD